MRTLLIISVVLAIVNPACNSIKNKIQGLWIVEDFHGKELNQKVFMLVNAMIFKQNKVFVPNVSTELPYEITEVDDQTYIKFIYPDEPYNKEFKVLYELTAEDKGRKIVLTLDNERYKISMARQNR